MTPIDYKDILKILNEKLEADGFIERFVLETQEFDGKQYTFLVINNQLKELSIALSYCADELDEWTIEFLGTHSHIDCDISIETIYKDYIKLILKNDLVAVHYFDDNGRLGMMTEEVIPEQIPFTFSEEERREAMKNIYRVVNWSGDVTDEVIRCYAISDRKDVNEFKYTFFAEWFNK
ncbi:MAG: hypothetical protein K2K60_07160, partial [Clostridia bacterium]|nr:hypothetical protein [Clostridia bacterium]